MVPFAIDLRLDFSLMLLGCLLMALLTWLRRKSPNPSLTTPALLALWMIGSHVPMLYENFLEVGRVTVRWRIAAQLYCGLYWALG